ncbi:hypothetical protein VB780_26575 [Leptolyngbya sp. CCNP1308]|uniref:hypothetical protein n=1 Tax=Leptolyngbya sp. CCNP1308 TaxID=3110255 RepID=UPI002B219293|nr:hypothetical protein [Leptolyngbya sp. CCNP1308]MEA5452167.1 hypothetical protein [Leptolyngbya sp. CCNP1308]
MASFWLLGFRLQPSTSWRRFARLMGAALVGSSLLALPGQRAQGQSISAATVTEILDSNQVYIQNRAAQVNSVAQQRQQVRTQDARASLRFNTGAVARLAHNSSLVIGQCAQINRGTLLVNGNLNGCSTSTVAGVRGTIYTIEVTESGETIIQVFEGEVVVERNASPEPVDPMADDFDPLDPTLDPAVPTTDPVVPFVHPMEPSRPPIDPAPVGPSDPLIPDPVTPDPVTPAPTGPTTPTGPVTGPLGFLTAPKQNSASPVDDEDSKPALPTDETQAETVDFAPEDSITLAEGQQAIVDAEADEAVISPLSPEDFIDLLEGPLIDGFAVEIPGMANLRRSFEQLFPGVPLPYYWLPSIPSPPIRFPFPF